ncbi:HNH endonuclease [Arthrospiribacter ruber]|uniref:HNH endonuclease n=1 Tax=Arthrospiribacter ruber TaxID=2487934 RepID=A0A951J0C5_9BACT|nr:HNH endonuclease signature motif containing protein [Arthrospiribacter ruber]MBW3469037.1 HNH endonuclease [Arthrospiribacter ruber]
MKKTRSQIFEDLNVFPTNSRWAWCAKNDAIKTAVFTLWNDEEKDGVWILHDDDGSYKKNGYFDQERVLNLAIDNNFEAFGIVVHAVDVSESPRSIQFVEESFLIQLKLSRRGSKIYGKEIKKIPYLKVARNNKSKIESHGLLDLESPPLGREFADRAFSKGFLFKRDQKVRKYVLNRAKGKCEYCGELGFELKSGENYLETHHIISLASQGSDTITNVIALCPNHHRQAHFGSNAETLEKEFIAILEGLNE